jgi:hypothetical protein
MMATRDTASDRRHELEDDDRLPEMDVRTEDLEPHEGLRYIARLFKVLAILLILLMIGEIIYALVSRGAEAIPTIMVEATRNLVFAGLLWGAGDMALMLIESNHDLRATRILVGRLNGRVARLEAAYLPRGGGSPRASVEGGGATGGSGSPRATGETERPPSHREEL